MACRPNDWRHGARGPWWIYGLKDPRTDSVRWVGRTTNCDARLRAHCTSANKGTCNPALRTWIGRLRKAGRCPTMETLAIVYARADAQFTEAFFMDQFRARGALLLNKFRPHTEPRDLEHLELDQDDAYWARLDAWAASRPDIYPRQEEA